MSVLLSIPHMTPTHWVLALTPHKPYLMNKMDNQCGAVSEVAYRHSGQEWLDEKPPTRSASVTCLCLCILLKPSPIVTQSPVIN